jgi:hypothetical protein
MTSETMKSKKSTAPLRVVRVPSTSEIVVFW